MSLGLVDFYAFLVMLLSFGLFRLCGGVLNLFNPASLFFVFHLVLFGVGSWYRWFYEGKVWVGDESVFIVYSSLLLYSLGAFVVAAVLSFSAPSLSLARILARASFVEFSLLSRLLIITVPVLIALSYSLHVGGLVWLQADIDDLRVEVRKGIGWLSLLGIASSFVGALVYLFSHRAIGWVEGVFVVVLLSACAASYGNRAPGAEVFIAGMFSLFVLKSGRVPIVRLVLAGGVVFILVAMAGLYRQGFEVSLLGVLQQVLWRPFVNFQNFQILYSAFPSLVPFQMGNGYLIDLSVLMPGYQPNYSVWLKEVLQMEFSGGGVNQTYLGEFYSNFSLIPALFCSFLLGVFLQFLYCLMCAVRCTLPFMLVVAFSLKAMVSSGLLSPIMYNLIPFVFIYLSYRLVLGVVVYEKA